MDPVDTVGVHVIDEPARAPDPRDEHELVGRDPELGHEALDGREDCVVPAARAPPYLLVADEVLLRQRAQAARDGLPDVAAFAVPVSLRRVAHSRLRISASTSAAWIGCPWTLLYRSAPTRNSARRILHSWPAFISGISTFEYFRRTSSVFFGSGLRCIR